jgi:nucleoside diphosphate kinase
MFGPGAELTKEFAKIVHGGNAIKKEDASILADYILRTYMPNPKTGNRKRALMLLFEGEDAIEAVKKVTGPLHTNMEAGETIRDTFGDFIVNNENNIVYVEPAVLVGHSKESTAQVLHLWSAHEEADAGIIDNADDISSAQDSERTLVLIKPDNFRFPNTRPGAIIDMFSRSGLRIVGVKLHRMSCAEAEEFYGPVRQVLREKLRDMVASKAVAAIEERLNIKLPAEIETQIGTLVAPVFGDQQFSDIVHFMTGCRPDKCPSEQKSDSGSERCLALVYAGKDAVNIIRSILGPTDPTKASAGTVRRELGQSIMVNAAHASDSPENAKREIKIINFDVPNVSRLTELYYPAQAEKD